MTLKPDVTIDDTGQRIRGYNLLNTKKHKRFIDGKKLTIVKINSAGNTLLFTSKVFILSNILIGNKITLRKYKIVRENTKYNN